MRYLSMNAVTPCLVSHSPICLPSWSTARNWYPPPGQTTTAAPLALPSGGKKMVSDGLSASSVPLAPGAPCGQSSSTLVASGGVLKTSASVIRVQLMGKLILSLSLALSRSPHIRRARNSEQDDEYPAFPRDSTI